MRDLLGTFLFLVLFGSCACVVIQTTEDRQRCAPLCAPYDYAKVTAQGECVCNITQVIKENE